MLFALFIVVVVAIASSDDEMGPGDDEEQEPATMSFALCDESLFSMYTCTSI